MFCKLNPFHSKIPYFRMVEKQWKNINEEQVLNSKLGITKTFEFELMKKIQEISLFNQLTLLTV